VLDTLKTSGSGATEAEDWEKLNSSPKIVVETVIDLHQDVSKLELESLAAKFNRMAHE